MSHLIKKGEVRNPLGRPKGTVTQKTRMYNVIDILEKRGFNPVHAMISIATEAKDEGVRRLATKDLLDRVVPVLRSIQHEGDFKNSYILNVTYTKPQ